MASKHLWILDAGHGGIIDGIYQTKGKRSPIWPDHRQLFEGEFNRDIVNRLTPMLDKVGIDYHVLVPSQKDVPLHKRVKTINKIFTGDKRAVVVSIHANAGGGTGWEVYTSPGHTKSDIIATFFYQAHKTMFPAARFRLDWRDNDPDKEAKFYILTKSYCPAILTENFFMDTLNPDCELIMSDQGREQIARAHFNAMNKMEK